MQPLTSMYLRLTEVIINSDIENRFNYHKPDAKAMENHQAIRDYFRSTANVVRDILPDSRELSLALTSLEEAMFWSNAGIARLTPEGERR